MANLKPCPFCGDDDAQIQMKKKHADFPYRVKCWYCGAKSDYCRTIEAAVRAWNRRAYEYPKGTAASVRPHGRLIDANALSEHKFVCIPHVSVDGKEAGSAYRLGWNTAIEAIVENAETIIGEE